jgi:hypothetical protein
MPGRFTNGLPTRTNRTIQAPPVPERPVGGLVLQAALALLWGATFAGDPKPKAADPGEDAELLEFLGSVDSGADSQATADDGSWIDYLSQTDIGKVAKAADPKDPARKSDTTDAPAPAPGDKKNE